MLQKSYNNNFGRRIRVRRATASAIEKNIANPRSSMYRVDRFIADYQKANPEPSV